MTTYGVTNDGKVDPLFSVTPWPIRTRYGMSDVSWRCEVSLSLQCCEQCRTMLCRVITGPDSKLLISHVEDELIYFGDAENRFGLFLCSGSADQGDGGVGMWLVGYVWGGLQRNSDISMPHTCARTHEHTRSHFPRYNPRGCEKANVMAFLNFP